MSMYDIDLFSQNDIPEYGKEGKDGGERRFSIDDGKGDVVDLEAVGEVPDAGSVAVGMGDDYYAVATVDEFLLGRRGWVRVVVGDVWWWGVEVTYGGKLIHV